MSFREYLHEKAEESRHDETLAYLMFLAGAVFFVGGILSTLSLSQEPSWFLIFPYQSAANAGAFLGLAMLISGMLLIVVGIIGGMWFSNERSWYMREMRKANSIKDNKMLKELKNEGGKKKGS